jgi:hypothetical protein
VNGIKAAREQIVARTDEDRSDFLRKRGFSKAETGKIIEKVLAEEGRPPESIFDFVQGITGLRARQDPAGCPPRHGGQGEEAARSGSLSPGRSRVFLKRGAAFSRVRGRRFAS